MSQKGSRAALFIAVAAMGAGTVLRAVCGPFSDVSDAVFCPFVLEIFTLGITTGTTPATYDPAGHVSRLQMAAFLSRSVDALARRGSRRALVKKFWAPQNAQVLGLTSLGTSTFAQFVRSDGKDLWVASSGSGSVSRVRASDGRLLGTWAGASGAVGVAVAMRGVFVAGVGSPGRLYRIDPSQPAGAVTTVSSGLGSSCQSLAFDGARLWSGNSFSGSISIITPGPTIPWTTTTITAGFFQPNDVVYDGSGIWVSDGIGRLLRVDTAGAILQTVTVGDDPARPVFDGVNLWVPNYFSHSISIVRASSGVILATLTGNGLFNPLSAAFDGERVLVSDLGGNGVSLWKGADATPLGFFPTGAGTNPYGACSDGIDFWIVLQGSNQLARF